MKEVLFYPQDDFPVYYDLDEDKRTKCIGACMQCPAFKGTTYPCDKTLKTYADIYKILKRYDLEDFACDDKNVVIENLKDYLYDIGDETCSQDVTLIIGYNMSIKEIGEL